ncbi:MAG: FG-GAP-like repeat-containing protein [Rudaea sp.]|nr:FG-GAP-like repeat-containing protein [Rudaea sp.]
MLAVADAAKGTSNIPVTMDFPLTRAGDTAYGVVVKYHAIDGSAVAGTDYLAPGFALLPPASASPTIPVTLTPNTTGGPDLSFQLQLDSAMGVGPMPSFAAHQNFGSPRDPVAVTLADINGDGKPDIVVANESYNTLSVLLDAQLRATVSGSAATGTIIHDYSFANGFE